MGWAQRAQVSTGNPVEQRASRSTAIDAKKHRAAFRGLGAPRFALAKFSDRTYLIDRHGTIRRAPVEAKPHGH